MIHAKLSALKGQEAVKALVIAPTRELAAQIAHVLARLVTGLRLRCCLLSAAGVVAGTDFGKVCLPKKTPYSTLKERFIEAK